MSGSGEAGFVRVGFDLPLEKTFLYSFSSGFFPRPGVRVKAGFGSRVLTGIVLSLCDAPGQDDPAPEKIKPLLSLLDAEPLLSSEHIALAEKMSEIYFCTLSEALFAMIPSGETGVVRPGRSGTGRASDINPLPPARLLPEQEKVRHQVSKALHSGRAASFLLYGVTGSGKSEVYYHLIRDTLHAGRSALLLVPEINLATQVLFQIGRYFPPDTISVLHSRLTANQKTAEWKAIAANRKRIVIGARSAVFAPLVNPGLFILDEEQSSSYKEHSRPRYHARQVAWLRARAHQAVLLLGSATPSLESFHYARKKIYTPLLLAERHNQAPLPSITVIPHRDGRSELTPELIGALRMRLERGEQSIILHNRRGFAEVMLCLSCGKTVRCGQCSISMTWHKHPPGLQCHYCGSRSDPPPVCPECGAASLIPRGAGTQKLEAMLEKIFPGARIVRFDADSTRKKYSVENAYFDFLNGKTDILVGTQMLSKGLHFPGVTLAGVVNFEDMASLPDYRSFENTFSMLLQVAGRTGRGSLPGEVLIQARDPSHPLIALLKRNDFNAFYRQEIEIRRQALYPPFCRLVRILFRGSVEEEVIKAAEEAGRIIRLQGELFLDVLGPVQAPLQRIQGQFRWHILVKFDRMTRPIRDVLTLLQDASSAGRAKCDLDPDPVSLL